MHGFLEKASQMDAWMNVKFPLKCHYYILVWTKVPFYHKLILFETCIQTTCISTILDKNVSLNFSNNLHKIMKNDYKRNYKKPSFDADMDIFNQNCLETHSWHQNRINHILQLMYHYEVTSFNPLNPP